MKKEITVCLAVLWVTLFSALPSFGQFDERFFPPKDAPERIGTESARDVVVWQLIDATNERVVIGSGAAWDGAAMLGDPNYIIRKPEVALETVKSGLLGVVDKYITSATATNSPDDLVYHTDESILGDAGLPSDFWITRAPVRTQMRDEYGWDGVYRIITNLIYTAGEGQLLAGSATGSSLACNVSLVFPDFSAPCDALALAGLSQPITNLTAAAFVQGFDADSSYDWAGYVASPLGSTSIDDEVFLSIGTLAGSADSGYPAIFAYNNAVAAQLPGLSATLTTWIKYNDVQLGSLCINDSPEWNAVRAKAASCGISLSGDDAEWAEFATGGALAVLADGTRVVAQQLYTLANADCSLCDFVSVWPQGGDGTSAEIDEGLFCDNVEYSAGGVWWQFQLTPQCANLYSSAGFSHVAEWGFRYK